MCTGSNHAYYLKRRRLYRRKLNQEVQNLSVHCTPQEFDEKYVGKAGLPPFENQWDETTDGHWGMDMQYYKYLRKRHSNWSDPTAYGKEVKYYLKKKIKRH